MSKARKQLFCDQTINKANPERNEKEKKEYILGASGAPTTNYLLTLTPSLTTKSDNAKLHVLFFKSQSARHKIVALV
jgi:hypothetical protein